MNSLVASLGAGALGLLGLALIWQGSLIYARYDGREHAAFAAFTALIGVSAVGAAVAFPLGDGFDGRWLYVVVQTPITLAAVPWFAFAVGYVGRDALASNRRIGALVVPIVLYTAFQVGWIATVGDPLEGELFVIAWWLAIMYQLGLLFVGGPSCFTPPPRRLASPPDRSSG